MATSDIWSSTGIPRQGEALFAQIAKGFSTKVFDALASSSGLPKTDISKALAMAPATLSRRAKSGVFTRDESDRLYRFAQQLSAATDLFGGNTTKAVRWMTRPVRGLGDRRPIDMLSTSAEAQAVIDLIVRLEHGVIS